MRHATVIVLLILITFSTVCNADREKRSVANAIATFVPLVGETVEAAHDKIKEISGDILSEIYFDIINYSKWTLSNPHHDIKHGVTLLAPQLVLPGYREAAAAQHIFADGIGTKGITIWSTSPGRLCFYYWYVEHSVVWREDNELALGCLPESHPHENLFDLVESVKDDPDKRDEYMVYQKYGKDLPTIQFCDDVLCFQGSMTSSHQCKATIGVYPKNYTDLAPKVFEQLDQGNQNNKSEAQGTLDKILNKENDYILRRTSGKAKAFRFEEVIFLVTAGFFLNL